jgi:hypothetical protein
MTSIPANASVLPIAPVCAFISAFSSGFPHLSAGTTFDPAGEAMISFPFSPERIVRS